MFDDYEDRIFLGHCLDVLKQLPDESFHAVVTDPPYGLGTKEPTVKQLVAFLKGANLDTGGDFMGADWEIPSVPIWREVYRVLKPGGHVLSFGGTRSWDLISMGLRAAGFEYRDTIADECAALQWIHGQGMPKSLNVSKSIDRRAGAKPVRTGMPKPGHEKYFGTDSTGHAKGWDRPWMHDSEASTRYHEATAPATAEAKVWDGYGTGLKPSWEPILVFRKPLSGTVADNILEHGTAAINIDATRVKHASPEDFAQHKAQVEAVKAKGGVREGSWKNSSDLSGANNVKEGGRWPSNLTLTHSPGCKRVGVKKVTTGGSGVVPVVSSSAGYHGPSLGKDSRKKGDIRHTHKNVDGTETTEDWRCVKGCPVRELDEQSGKLQSGVKHIGRGARCDGHPDWRFAEGGASYGDSGGASRFFPSFEGQEPVEVPFHYCAKPGKKETQLDGLIHNNHPTKKPVALMKWLVRLVCFKGAKVLDPYCGSGSTLHAACEEEVLYTGIERDPAAHATATARMDIVSGREQDRQNERSAFDIAMGLDDDE